MHLPDILNTPGFMPHGHCFLWNPQLLLLMVASDAGIALAYFFIPITLLYLVHKRRAFRFRGLVYLFAAFILACGLTHVLSLWDIWHGGYWLEASVKAITAVISVVTALTLLPLLPRLLSLPSREELQQANQQLHSQMELVKATSATLSASEARYRQLLDTTLEGVWMLDLNGITTFVNQAMAHMLGYEEEEMQGKSLFEFINEDHRQQAEGNMRRRLQGIAERHDFQFRRKDGETMAAIVSTSPIFGNEGEVVGMLGVITDITERERIGTELARLMASLEERVQQRTAELEQANAKLMQWVSEQKATSRELEDNESRLRAVLDSTVDGIITIDEEGRILSINPAVTTIFGYTDLELLGHNVSELMPSPDRERHDHYLHNYLDSGVAKIIGIGREVMGQHKNGWQFPVDLAVSVLSLEGERQFVGLVRDITERKRAEESIRHLNTELIHLNDDLEQQIQEKQSAEAKLQDVNTQLQALVESMREHTEFVSLLNEMSELLQSCLNIPEAARVLAHFVKQLLKADSGGLYLGDSDGNTLRRVAAWGSNDGESCGEFHHDECWAMRQGRVHPAGLLQLNLGCAHLSQGEERYSLCIPLYAQGHIVGLLNLGRGAAFVESNGELPCSRQILQSFSEQVALAIANINLRERLENLSQRDPLTGLFNRRYLNDVFEEELARCTRANLPLSVLMLDIDHFKRFNDSFGHDAGDHLLQEVALALLGNVRERDIVTRYGGEEFTILMPAASLQRAQERAEAIRVAVAGTTLVHRGVELGRVTVSIGLAANPQHGKTTQQLLLAADKALYQAKEQGRDRVLVFQEG